MGRMVILAPISAMRMETELTIRLDTDCLLYTSGQMLADMAYSIGLSWPYRSSIAYYSYVKGIFELLLAIWENGRGDVKPSPGKLAEYTEKQRVWKTHVHKAILSGEEMIAKEADRSGSSSSASSFTGADEYDDSSVSPQEDGGTEAPAFQYPETIRWSCLLYTSRCV